jgi:hypothetical protein
VEEPIRDLKIIKGGEVLDIHCSRTGA